MKCSSPSSSRLEGIYLFGKPFQVFKAHFIQVKVKIELKVNNPISATIEISSKGFALKVIKAK
jgi:hypothetical protein